MASLLFKSEIITFICLFVVLSVAGFLDMICSFVELFVKLDKPGTSDFIIDLMKVLRYTFAIVFPNVTIKRGLYNLKIRKNNYCIDTLNNLLTSKHLYLIFDVFEFFKKIILKNSSWFFQKWNSTVVQRAGYRVYAAVLLATIFILQLHTIRLWVKVLFRLEIAEESQSDPFQAFAWEQNFLKWTQIKCVARVVADRNV